MEDMKRFISIVGLVLAAMVLVLVSQLGQMELPMQVTEPNPNPPTKEERIGQVIEDCRRELQVDGPCLAYDKLRRTNPQEAEKIVSQNPQLKPFADAISKIESER